MRIKIDPEFSGLLRKLTDDEHRLLEESLIDDPSKIILTVWKETSILIDGQHRYDICKRKKLKWKVHAKSFPDRDSAKLWVWMHAAGQRNLTDVERREIVGLVYQTRKKMVGRPADDAEASESAGKTSAENSATVAELSQTAAQVAEEFGVAERSVRNADEWATALANVHNAIADGVRTKKISASLDDLKKFAELDTDAKRPIVALAKRGELKSLKEVMREPGKISGGTTFDTEEIEEAGKPSVETMAKPYKKARSDLQAGKRFVKGVFDDEAQAGYANSSRDRILKDLDAVQGIIAWLDQVTPEALCKECKGKGCKKCHKTGWVPKGVLQNTGKK